MSVSITSGSITDGQWKQIGRFFHDTNERILREVVVSLDKDGAQKFLSNGGEYQSRSMAMVRELSISNQFADEEVDSDYAYSQEYKGPKPIEDQIKATSGIFGLDSTKALEYAKNLPALPEGAEGWFAIPSVESLAAKYFPEVSDPAEKYCRAVQLIFEKIAATRPFKNWREGQIDKDHLRICVRTADALKMVANTQVGDIFIIAAQLGMRHRGRSVRRARECFVANEFGLGSLIVGAIALTHPERLVCYEELDMDCAGDEFSGAGDGAFSHAPCSNWYDRAGFDTNSVDNASEDYGSASGFLPQ